MAEVETARDGGVLTITLNRPDVLNAFNRDMHKALGEALKEARDSEIRAVALTGVTTIAAVSCCMQLCSCGH